MSTEEDREWDAHWDRVEEDQDRHEAHTVVYVGGGKYAVLDAFGHNYGEYGDRDAAQEAADALNDDYDPGDDMRAEQAVRY